MKFYQLGIGARFTHLGKEFTKVAMALGEDSRHHGHVFMGYYVVEPVGEPLLLPPEEAARWKPDYEP